MVKTTCLLLLLAFAIGCGGYSSSSGPNMSGGGAASNIQTLMPNSAAAGGPAFTLTVNGSGFSQGSVVFWNGVAHTTAFVTANQLTARIAAADIANPATVPVYVHTTGGIYGNGVNSNTVNFMVN